VVPLLQMEMVSVDVEGPKPPVVEKKVEADQGSQGSRGSGYELLAFCDLGS
jgi:hypothetical protein